MRNTLESVVGNYRLYKARRTEYDTGETIPFRVSPEPLLLSPQQAQEIQNIGLEITQFIQAAHELYLRDDVVRSILNTGKPEIFLADKNINYLFVRPDVIITPEGFAVCEIETSPFGLALAELLNRAYRTEGMETMVGDNVLMDHVRSATPTNGVILYSQKTSSYSGQIKFLSDEIFSGNDRTWQTSTTDEIDYDRLNNVYRAFYLSEYLSDPTVTSLIDSALSQLITILPSITPHIEEKALLALLWDRRFETFFQKHLGNGTFSHLRMVIPPTWIVGQEQYFAPGLPDGISSSMDLATVTRAKRALVIKPSGFSPNSSWSEGVQFLHTKSADNVRAIIEVARSDSSCLYVVQQFRKGIPISMAYETNEGLLPMNAKVRMTPYFILLGDNEGKLIAIKATGCENTDYIHASSVSINTAVAIATEQYF